MKLQIMKTFTTQHADFAIKNFIQYLTSIQNLIEMFILLITLHTIFC